MNALEVRKAVKKRKPVFLMQDTKARKTLPNKYIKPRGLHSKMRLSKKGHPKTPSQGYRSPLEVRGTTRKGLIPVVISNVAELSNLDSRKIVVVSRRVGMKKRVAILKAATEKKYKIFNIKAADYIKKAEENIQKRKQKGKKAVKTEEKPKETKKKGIEAALTDEEKEKKDKIDRDKILTKSK